MPRDLKIVLLGDSGVGKTCIAQRASTGTFRSASTATIGAGHVDIPVNTAKQGKVTLSVWDTAGQERFRTLIPMYFRGSAGAIVVFDITQRSSFTSVPDWVTMLTENVTDCPIVLVGNKVDLRDDGTVTWQEGEDLRLRINAGSYVETSALTGQNIEALFADVAEEVLAGHEGEFARGPAANAPVAAPVPNTDGGRCC
jgi:small GTP-binding protein